MEETGKRFKERFPFGLKGVFTVKPFYKTVVKDKHFLIAVLIAAILPIILIFFSDKQIFYIDMVNELIISIIPAILGLSLAGFAIVISQASEKSLSRMADLDIEKNDDYSLYQKLNAVFSVTVLAQLVPLIIATFVRLIKPLSLEVSVSFFMASTGNAIVLFVELLSFLYALFSIIDLIKNIFNTGQIVNFIIIKNKIKKGPTVTL